jgi:hypothetical protein
MVSKKYGSILCMVGLLAIFSWVSAAHTKRTSILWAN